METCCPKCHANNWNETISVHNNPNLVTCKYCGHVYFVEIKVIIKKAVKGKDGCYTLK